MATIKTKLKQLKDADVRFISLVDRAASRIPFRVLKRDKESKMGIDLTSVFKSDAGVKPHVSALVVFAQKDEAVGNQVRDAIKAHGFATDRVQKSDEGETLVYAQGDQPKHTHVVRLSDQLLVSVAGLKTPTGWTGEMVEENGFFPDIKLASETLQARMLDVVTKSETPQAEAEAALVSYAEYLNQVVVLPTNCFKLEAAISEIVAKCSCEAKEEVSKDETEEERKKRIAEHPPSEMAPVDEEDDQKPPPDADWSAKAESILTALKGIETTVTSLATKLDVVTTEQANQKKTLDGVVQKADTLDTTLKATVTAVPAPEDRPSHARMRVQKDDDPRTGNFDTAFLRRRR